MPYVPIDHTIAFAIDAAAKASDMQKLDQNIDYIEALMKTATGHTHDQSGGSHEGGPVVPADGSVTTPKIVDANVTLAKLKMASGSWSGTIGAQATVSILTNRYFHLNQSYTTGADSVFLTAYSASGWTTGVSFYNKNTANSYSLGISWDYHTN